MQSLLGLITNISDRPETPDTLEVSFKPLCVLPGRDPVPEWLKDQTLKLERKAANRAELGRPGDSIVLTTAEARKWLYPLSVVSAVARGAVPDRLRIELAWWKDEKAPDYTLKCAGRQVVGNLARDGEVFAAEIDTGSFFESAPKLPVHFEITCDKLAVACTVLPENEPFAAKLQPPTGEVHRMENEWYAVDVSPLSHCGAISRLVEKGRQVDHFASPDDRILLPIEWGGHTDRIARHGRWWRDMDTARMTSVGAGREAGAVQLRLEGSADESSTVRTGVIYTLHDDLPLLTWRRDYHLQPGKKEDDKGKPEKPKQPIDDMWSAALGFRAAWAIERDGHCGSRFLCVDEEGVLHVVRYSRASYWPEPWLAGSIFERGWQMAGGWILVEHPCRRESMLYFFDPNTRPTLCTAFTERAVWLEPEWPRTLVRPGSSTGMSLGLAAGELCGASEKGAWVGCRTLTGSGVRCGLVGRFAGDVRSIELRLGTEQRTVELRQALVPGLGVLSCATADFDGADFDRDFDVLVADIASGRQS